MSKNLASLDRTVRILAAVILFVLILTGGLTGTAAIILGILAAVLLATGTVAFCPIYHMMGISSLKKNEQK